MENHQVHLPKAEILIVDDVPDNLRFLSAMLTEYGYEVRKAINGKMALKSVESELPDLILLDIQMPGMNGYEVCTLLKASAATQEIPVVFLSALDDVLDKVKAFEVGGVDYIAKPFHFEEVLARVENQLTIRKLQKELQAQNSRLQAEIQERRRVEAALQEANKKLQCLAKLDGLTQVANRRYFDESMNHEWEKLLHEKKPLSLILCDVDYFKLYNDTYGHQAGDDCLQKVAQTMSFTVTDYSPDHLVARYGGEEFAVILPNTPLTVAVEIAEAIRFAIQNLQILHTASTVHEYVTLSLGISNIIPGLESSLETLVTVADQALYEAKQQGRNRVIVKLLNNII